ncbi:MAG TPA: putative ABC exporter domain-containing protein [Thermoanaerobaculia bacterium]|nr:putative ABC exporter domain-containing protein [Thermoanaerobaculia bacterium]
MVLRAFLFVTLHSVRNRFLHQLRRLRQPRYLVSAIVGLGYFYWVYFKRTFAAGAAGHLPLARQVGDLGVGIISLGVLAMMVLAWALPSDSGGLVFSEAEIQFFFPAPVSRRQLLLYKLLRSQPQLFITAGIMTLLGAVRGRGIGTWIAFSVMGIYMMMVSLGRARLRRAGFGFVPRLIAVLLVCAGLTLLVAAQFERGPMIDTFRSTTGMHLGPLLKLMAEPLHHAPLSVLLFVPRLFATAVVPPEPMDLAISILGLAVLAVVLFFITTRFDVAFEEASIVQSAKMKQRLERRTGRNRSGTVAFPRARPLFQLAETGRPEIAILWKNLIAVVRRSPIRLLIAMVFFGLTISIVVQRMYPNAVATCGLIALAMAGFFALLGPVLLRNDLRLDISRLEILKSLPISGEALIAGEIAAPLAMIASGEIILLVTGVALLRISAVALGPLRVLLTPEFVVTALILAIPISAMQLLIQNAAVVLLPAWANPPKEEAQGIPATGQRLLMLIAHLVVLTVCLIPPAILLLPSVWIATKYFGGSSALIALAALPPVAVLVAEIWMAIRLLGDQFDQIDVSSDVEAVG